MKLDQVSTEISHLDGIGHNPEQLHIAKAKGRIMLQKATIQLIIENKIKKGNVFLVAQLSGIQAAKKTSELIPLCHSLDSIKINVECTPFENGIEATSEVRSIGQSVEMEALTAVSVALLTIYDMCKPNDNKMEISQIHLTEQTVQQN